MTDSVDAAPPHDPWKDWDRVEREEDNALFQVANQEMYDRWVEATQNPPPEPSPPPAPPPAMVPFPVSPEDSRARVLREMAAAQATLATAAPPPPRQSRREREPVRATLAPRPAAPPGQIEPEERAFQAAARAAQPGSRGVAAAPPAPSLRVADPTRPAGFPFSAPPVAAPSGPTPGLPASPPTSPFNPFRAVTAPASGPAQPPPTAAPAQRPTPTTAASVPAPAMCPATPLDRPGAWATSRSDVVRDRGMTAARQAANDRPPPANPLVSFISWAVPAVGNLIWKAAGDSVAKVDGNLDKAAVKTWIATPLGGVLDRIAADPRGALQAAGNAARALTNPAALGASAVNVLRGAGPSLVNHLHATPGMLVQNFGKLQSFTSAFHQAARSGGLDGVKVHVQNELLKAWKDPTFKAYWGDVFKIDLKSTADHPFMVTAKSVKNPLMNFTEFTKGPVVDIAFVAADGKITAKEVLTTFLPKAIAVRAGPGALPAEIALGMVMKWGFGELEKAAAKDPNSFWAGLNRGLDGATLDLGKFKAVLTDGEGRALLYDSLMKEALNPLVDTPFERNWNELPDPFKPLLLVASSGVGWAVANEFSRNATGKSLNAHLGDWSNQTGQWLADSAGRIGEAPLPSASAEFAGAITLSP